MNLCGIVEIATTFGMDASTPSRYVFIASEYSSYKNDWSIEDCYLLWEKSQKRCHNDHRCVFGSNTKRVKKEEEQKGLDTNIVRLFSCREKYSGATG